MKAQEAGKAKVKVFIYNLEDYEIKEVEVDYISDSGKAVIRAKGSVSPPKIYSNFSYSFKEAYEQCSKHLNYKFWYIEATKCRLLSLQVKLLSSHVESNSRGKQDNS